jgi:hypothetical protein
VVGIEYVVRRRTLRERCVLVKVRARDVRRTLATVASRFLGNPMPQHGSFRAGGADGWASVSHMGAPVLKAGDGATSGD